MSTQEFFADILHGELRHAFSRLVDWHNSWPTPLKSFVDKWSADAQSVLLNAIVELGTDFIAGKSVPEAAEEAIKTGKEAIIKASKDDVMDAIRMIKSAS